MGEATENGIISGVILRTFVVTNVAYETWKTCATASADITIGELRARRSAVSMTCGVISIRTDATSAEMYGTHRRIVTATMVGIGTTATIGTTAIIATAIIATV